jgi:hypothetical protein
MFVRRFPMPGKKAYGGILQEFWSENSTGNEIRLNREFLKNSD